jgi:hypothetical protein
MAAAVGCGLAGHEVLVLEGASAVYLLLRCRTGVDLNIATRLVRLGLVSRLHQT